jgi:hypothetical protein
MKKITAALALATSLLASGSAVAAVDFVDYTGAVPSTTISWATNNGTASVAFNQTVVGAWLDDTKGTRQDLVSIAAGVSDATKQTFTAADLTKFSPDANSFTYDPAGTFSYLALHLGAGTLLVQFQGAIGDVGFTTSGFGSGISNVFGFAGPSEVPVPGAIWLLGTALLGFIGLSRRKAISAA